MSKKVHNSTFEDPTEEQSCGHCHKELISSTKFSENFNGFRDNVVSPISTEEEDTLSYLSFTSSSMSAEDMSSIEDIERNVVKLNKRKARLAKHRNKRHELNGRGHNSQGNPDNAPNKEVKKVSTHSSMITNRLEM